MKTTQMPSGRGDWLKELQQEHMRDSCVAVKNNGVDLYEEVKKRAGALS